MMPASMRFLVPTGGLAADPDCPGPALGAQLASTKKSETSSLTDKRGTIPASCCSPQGMHSTARASISKDAVEYAVGPEYRDANRGWFVYSSDYGAGTG